jgi:hypothetical protein
LLTQLFDAASTIASLDRSRLTLSERHVNVYAADAAPFPRPHKDRLASQVSIGISIDVPPGSHLVLWPDDDRYPNPLQRPGLTESLPPESIPEASLAGARPVCIYDRPGDVVLFAGSAMWHTRHNPADAVVVYFKCNDFGSDPLGEDPGTEAVEECSRSLARSGVLPGTYVSLARRFEAISREHELRLDAQWVNVHVAGKPPRRVTASECAILEAVDGGTTVAELCAKSVADVDSVVRLVDLGALELRQASPDAGV